MIDAGAKSHGDSRPQFPTPMYDGLETNIPNSLMEHSDDHSLRKHQLFPSRETVLEYLEDYAADIKHLVHFRTQVTDIRLTKREGQHTWSMQVRELASNQSVEKEFDAVCVANGHYNVPMIPDIKGIRQWDMANPGVITHSKFYRNAAAYRNKKIVVVGNSASGIDIASQLAPVAKHPILMSQRSDSPLAFAPPYQETLPEIKEFISPSSMRRAVCFSDGRIEVDIDAILFCTGYCYSFPFLSSLTPPLIKTGARVEHLYEHLFYIYHPSLAFIGLPSKIIPFRTFEGQAAVLARVWSDRLELPSTQEMERWEQELIGKRGCGRSFHILPFPKDFGYHNEMVDWASKAIDKQDGKMPPKWSEQELWVRERIPVIKGAFAGMGEGRHKVKTVEGAGFDYYAWATEEQLL